jgi:hypothetical protein
MKKNEILVISALIFIVVLRLVAASGNYNVEVTDVSPTSLVPGEKSGLTFRIENTGDEDLKNIIFSWEEKTGNILPIGSSNTKSIDGLNEGDDEKLDFDVFTSAYTAPGLYELTLTITYNNGTATVTKTSEAGIIVGGQTDFDVSVSDISSSGITLSVANIGKNPADSVTVIIPEQANFRVSGSTSSIIGNLDKGDYSVASFQLTPMSRGSSSLNVEIQYTDTVGNRQTLTKTVEVQSTQSSSSLTTGSSTASANSFTSSSSSSGSKWFLIAFISSMVLTVILIIVIVRRSKRKNEQEI